MGAYLALGLGVGLLVPLYIARLSRPSRKLAHMSTAQLLSTARHLERMGFRHFSYRNEYNRRKRWAWLKRVTGN
jgi:hypothetical protein